MSHTELRKSLSRKHTPDAIQERLESETNASYLRDAVLGAIDGCVTTFALVAGATGAGFSSVVALVLGVSSLLADGLSMAISNYQGSKTEQERLHQAYHMENLHIDHYPEGEIEEIRQIFAMKGFEGVVLDQIVEVITSDRQLWLDTMITEEHGLSLTAPDPLRAGLATFGAFVAVGLVPLLPFFMPTLFGGALFIASATLTAFAFFGIGIAKGKLMGQAPLRTGLEMLLTGGLAAVVAYGLGHGLESVLAG